MTLSAGHRLGRYEVRSRLGSGGMGDVYRALDTTLGRDVAVKVLPDGMAGDRQRLERFQLEAKAVAALSHPNILEIHDFGNDEGVRYAVTELLEGETLRERIPPTGMAWQRVVDLGAEIADALAAAHGSGVVHRDIKPENIFVTNTGRVKVLDFGLASVRELTTPEQPAGVQIDADTQVGSVVGTVGYLSPEQVDGAEIDGRSDIFALGCVLYEMTTSRRAFFKDTVAETLYATLREDPTLPSAMGAIIPAELERVIARCLEKDPKARFQSAADLAFALRAISGESAPGGGARPAARSPRRRAAAIATAVIAAGAVIAVILISWFRTTDTTPGAVLDPNRVVVLPFENRTGDAELDVVGLMAADWLTQRLPDEVGVDFISSSSAVAASQRTGSGPDSSLEIARDFGAGTLVTGSYYRRSNQLQIKAELVATSNGKLLNSVEPATGPVAEPMVAVESLRQQILGLLAARDSKIAKFEPPTFDAYRELMAGLEIWLKDPELGLVHFRKAAELDPDLVVARLLISHSLWALNRFDESTAVLDALDADRHLLGSFDRLCLDCVILRRQHRYEESLPLLREIVSLDPLNPIITVGLVDALVWTNRPREAVETVEGLGGLHRLDLPHFYRLPEALHMLGEHERELEVVRLALEKYPRYEGEISYGLWRNHIHALAALGRSDEVTSLIERSPAHMRPLRVFAALEATAELRAHGWTRDAREFVDRFLERHPPPPSEGPWMRWQRAVLLTMAGRDHDALPIFAELAEDLEAAPALPDEYSAIPIFVGSPGIVAARLDDRETAESVLRQLEEMAGPRWYGADHYMRACIEAELGHRAAAVEQLHEMMLAGFQFNQTLHRNPYLEPLRGYEPFEEFLRPKG
jgi:tetratricopeptide (TPR) repeat protein